MGKKKNKIHKERKRGDQKPFLNRDVPISALFADIRVENVCVSVGSKILPILGATHFIH